MKTILMLLLTASFCGAQTKVWVAASRDNNETQLALAQDLANRLDKTEEFEAVYSWEECDLKLRYFSYAKGTGRYSIQDNSVYLGNGSAVISIDISEVKTSTVAISIILERVEEYATEDGGTSDYRTLIDPKPKLAAVNFPLGFEEKNNKKIAKKLREWIQGQ